MKANIPQHLRNPPSFHPLQKIEVASSEKAHFIASATQETNLGLRLVREVLSLMGIAEEDLVRNCSRIIEAIYIKYKRIRKI